jgi:hypothetical protein
MCTVEKQMGRLTRDVKAGPSPRSDDDASRGTHLKNGTPMQWFAPTVRCQTFERIFPCKNRDGLDQFLL